MCSTCGFPFEHDGGAGDNADGTLCGACARQTPTFGHARAVFAYDDASRRLILAFKHGDRTDAAPAFAGWMARAGQALVRDAELVVPVPLHRWRLLRRRYNQAALLARSLAADAGLIFAPDLLVRRRNTPSQARLSPSARRRNVAGAFAVRPSRRAGLGGRRVLLVDDVYTTGATVEAAARALRRGGAQGVDVLTLCRVVRGAG